MIVDNFSTSEYSELGISWEVVLFDDKEYIGTLWTI